MTKKRTGRSLFGAVMRRTVALFLCGVTLWGLWLTTDFHAAGAALRELGGSAELAMTLLAAELGRREEGNLSGWDRLVLSQSSLLWSGQEAVAALGEQTVEEDVSLEEIPTDEPEEESAAGGTVTPAEDIEEKTLTAGSSERYVTADGVYVYNHTNYKVDLATLTLPDYGLKQGSDQPQILIIHTHTTEAYAQSGTDVYLATGDARTIDDQYNMVRIGEEVAAVLEEAGWSVVHDTQWYDYPAYNGAYGRSGASVQKWLEQYPSIQIVLDLHRDALTASDGTVYKTVTEVNGEKTAQVMLVVGSDAGGLSHPNWRENLALAVAVQSGLNRTSPTFARPITLRSSRFNQQLTPGALLVEIGSHGNTLQEALAAARLFAASLAETLSQLT